MNRGNTGEDNLGWPVAHPLTPMVQFIIGVGVSLVVCAILVLCAIVGVPLRGVTWVVVFFVIWLMIFLVMRRRMYALVAGFMFGAFGAYVVLAARGFRIP